MFDSLISTEYIPNVHIEKIKHYEAKNLHRLSVTVCVFEDPDDKWSNNESFTKFLYTNIIVSADAKLNASITEGKVNIYKKLEGVTDSRYHKRLELFSSYEKMGEASHNGKKYIKYKKTFNFEIPDESQEYKKNTQIFVGNFINLEELIKNENIRFPTGEKTYGGSVKSEILFPKQQASKYIELGDKIWYGSIHPHEGRYMQGSQHGDIPHSFVEIRSVGKVKTEYIEEPKYSSKFFISSDRTTKPKKKNPTRRPFLLQKKITEDQKRNASNVVIFDLEEILIRESFHAKEIDKYDAEIMTEVAKKLDIIDIEIKRLSLNSSRKRHYNRLGSLKTTADESSPTTIAKSSNTSRKLIPKTLYQISPKTILSIDPTKAKKASPNKIFNGTQITDALLKNSRKIGKVEQMNLTLPENFRAINFTDYDVKLSKSGRYKYQAKITIKDEALLFCKNLLNDLLKYSRQLENLYNVLIMKNVFSGGKFSPTFLAEFYSQYDVNYNIGMEKVIGPFNTPALKNSYLFKSFETLSIAERLTGLRPLSKNLLNNLNLFTTSLESINTTIFHYNRIINIFKKRYNLDEGGGFDRSSTGKRKDRVLIQKTINLPETYVRKLLQPIGINFITQKTFDGTSEVSLENLVQRSEKEVKKFFPGVIKTSSKEIENLPKELRESFSDLQKNKFKSFSPAKIFFGNQELDTTEINNETFNVDFFNNLRIARAAIDSSKNNEIDDVSFTEEELDKYIDSREFLGETTQFNDLILRSIKVQPKKVLKARKKFRLLDNRVLKAKKRNISMKTFDISQPNNIIVKKLKAKQEMIPMQFKALSLLKTPITNFDMEKIDFDPISNPQTQEVFEQNYLNISGLKYLEGFEKINGKHTLGKPIYKEIESSNLDKLKNKNFLLEVFPLQVENLTMNQEQFNIFDSVMMLKNTSEDQMITAPTIDLGKNLIIDDSNIDPVSVNPMSLSNTDISTVPDINQYLNNNSFISLIPLQNKQAPAIMDAKMAKIASFQNLSERLRSNVRVSESVANVISMPVGGTNQGNTGGGY